MLLIVTTSTSEKVEIPLGRVSLECAYARAHQLSQDIALRKASIQDLNTGITYKVPLKSQPIIAKVN